MRADRLISLVLLLHALACVAGFIAGLILVMIMKRPERTRVEWWDTLLHTPTGVRLIRIDHDRALAAISTYRW
mgnify:CR=1 FL=1